MIPFLTFICVGCAVWAWLDLITDPQTWKGV